MKIVFFAVFLISQILLASQQIEKVIGQNDLVSVNSDASNIPQKFQKLVNAFGILSMGCTATHIGNGYVITAGHCFFAGSELQRNLNCEGTLIEWGVRAALTPYMVSKCESIVASQQNDRVDFAILKVSPVPDTSVEVDFQNRAQIGDLLTMFSHPDEKPLAWSNICMVENIPVNMKLSSEYLYHQCDSNQGSSGAVLINADTLKAVGLHSGGRIDASGATNFGSYMNNSEIADILKELGFK